ncbi:MAG: hypothetical protein ACPG8W_06710 [Candidatus Promineifilaceae bacterium]
MVKLEREEAPDFWTEEKVQEWTERWQAKECKSKRWGWPQHDKKRLNHHAIEAMEGWHHFKCAFCEKREPNPDVEHFKPKTADNGIHAFTWENLLLSCSDCNTDSKGSKLPENALKPDVDKPSDYLWVNPISLTVEPIPGIDSAARLRAEKTISLFGLDRPELKILYYDHLRHLAQQINPPMLSRASITPPIELTWFTQFVIENSETILAKAAPSEPFSLMVQYVVKRILRPVQEANHE